MRGDRKIAVLGAGLVGMLAAIGLSRLGYRVTLIEKQGPQAGPTSFGVDLRNLAFSPASRDFLLGMGLWDKAVAAPFGEMSIFESNGISDLRFNAAELGMPALGWIVEASKFQLGLWELLKREGVDTELRAVTRLASDGQSVDVSFDDRCTSFDFLIAADGVNSFARSEFAVPVNRRPCDQFGLVTLIRTELDHRGVALQKFLNQGPMALLPTIQPDVRSVVWSQSEGLARENLELSEPEFCLELGRLLGGCSGAIDEVGARFVFPLVQQRVKHFMPRKNILFIGDAARTIHPLAGFGANLGFEDVKGLLETVEAQGLDNPENLLEYARRREIRSDFVIRLMEGILKSYTAVSPVISWLRNASLRSLNNHKWIKDQLVREASGYGPIAKF